MIKADQFLKSWIRTELLIHGLPQQQQRARELKVEGSSRVRQAGPMSGNHVSYVVDSVSFLANLPWHGPDLVDIQLPLDGEYVIAHLVAGEESCAHILGKIELLIVELDPKEFPALAQLHVPVSSGDLLADLQYPGFHNNLTSLMIIIASCIYF